MNIVVIDGPDIREKIAEDTICIVSDGGAYYQVALAQPHCSKEVRAAMEALGCVRRDIGDYQYLSHRFAMSSNSNAVTVLAHKIANA